MITLKILSSKAISAYKLKTHALLFIVLNLTILQTQAYDAADNKLINNQTATTAHASGKMIITGSPIQQNIEGITEQLAHYDNQAIIDAGDLLIHFPGFSGSRAGGHAVDPILRGQSQTRLNFMQQGAFIHGAGPNRMDSPSAYTEPFGWDEVQIIKGIETLTLGAGGSAGSINFKRHKPNLSDDNFVGKVLGVYASDYYKFGADLAAGNDDGYLRLISQIHDQDSYEDGNGQLTRTAFRTVANTLVSAYTPNNHDEIRLSLTANRGSDALFAGTMMDGPVTDMDSAQLLYLDADNDPNNFSEYQIYWNKAHHMMDNYSLRQNTKPMKMLTDSHSKTMGAKWIKHWQSNQWTWQTSLDWQNVERHAERYMSMSTMPKNTMGSHTMSAHPMNGDAMNSNTMNGNTMNGNAMSESSMNGSSMNGSSMNGNPTNDNMMAHSMTNANEAPSQLQAHIWPNNELDIIGLAADAEYLIDENRRVKSGVRYDRVKADAKPLNNPEIAAIYQDYYAQTPSNITENNVSAFSRYYHNSERSLYWIGLSSSVRTADATERYMGAVNTMPMMRWIGNPNIQPERHNQIELGAKWRFESGWHELNVYYDSVDDFILRDRARAQPGILKQDMATIYRNVDATLAGFEWALQNELSDNWFFYTNLSYVKGKNKENDRPLYQIPPIEGLVQFSYQQDRLSAFLEMPWALKQDDIDSNPMTGSGLDAGESDTWSVFNLKVSYEITDNWQFSAGLDNILDKNYAYHVSRANNDPFNPEAIRVNEPGRQAWISVLFQL